MLATLGAMTVLKRHVECGSGGELSETTFLFFAIAARLVALVPISSAAVERVFSQVSIIIGSIGENVLEETLECRVMERVNKY